MILCSSHVTLIWIWLELTLLVAEVKGSFLYRWILVADMLLDVRLTVPLVVIDCLIHFRSAPLPLLLVVQCQDPAACHQLPTAPSGPQWSSGPHFGGCCSQAMQPAPGWRNRDGCEVRWPQLALQNRPRGFLRRRRKPAKGQPGYYTHRIHVCCIW